MRAAALILTLSVTGTAFAATENTLTSNIAKGAELRYVPRVAPPPSPRLVAPMRKSVPVGALVTAGIAAAAALPPAGVVAAAVIGGAIGAAVSVATEQPTEQPTEPAASVDTGEPRPFAHPVPPIVGGPIPPSTLEVTFPAASTIPLATVPAPR